MSHKHNTGQGHQNRSNPQSTTSIDCKLATGKDESFPSEAVKTGDITDIMGETLNMVEGLSMIWSRKQVTRILVLWLKIITKRLQQVN